MTRSIWTIAPPRERATATRERLIDAAAMLFYEHGFHAIGLDQILEEVGVTKTTFYNHFASKDDLIVAVLNYRDEHDIRLLEEELARRGGGPRDRILHVFDVVNDWISDPDFKGCLFINASAQFPNQSDPIHQAAANHAQQLYQRFVVLTREAGARSPELLSRQLGMLIAAAITSRQVDGDADAAVIARDMAVSLLDRSVCPG